MSNFESALNTKDFVITSEVLLGSRSGDEHVREHVELLSGHVDAMLATDNQSGRLHISSLATSVLLQQAGIEPIMQLGCRNRNRVALLGDLLGAYELGIRNVQLVRGERVPEGFKPRPKPELDVTATELVALQAKGYYDGEIDGQCDEGRRWRRQRTGSVPGRRHDDPGPTNRLARE